MKKLFITILLFTFFNASAQSTKLIDSFLGVKFGSSPLQVTTALKAKGGILDKKSSGSNILIFGNLSLGNRKTLYTAVRFINNKAYECLFGFKSELEPQTIDYYNSLVNDINNVYGAGDAYKNFKPPYEDGDGYEISAIQLGSAEYQTVWGTDDDKQPGSISVEISSKLFIKLSYQDKKLTDIAINKEKTKEKADF